MGAQVDRHDEQGAVGRIERIRLNFLPFQPKKFSFKVYVKPSLDSQEHAPFDHCWRYSLPKDGNRDERGSFWCAIEKREGFECRTVSSEDNLLLAVSVLHEAFKETVRKRFAANEFFIPDDSFRRYVELILRECEQGFECLSLEVYRLRESGQFGLLVDYHFKLREDASFDRTVQQLSGSLDEHYRSNKDYYRFKYAKASVFRDHLAKKLGAIEHPALAEPVPLCVDFVAVEASSLPMKMYVFGGGNEMNSQYLGARKFGPFRAAQNTPTFYFLFRERDRLLARHLYKSLRGEVFPVQFPGMEKMFNLPFSPDNVRHVVLPDFSEETLRKTVEQMKTEAGERAVPLVLVEGDEGSYYRQKAIFINAGVASQDVRAETVRDDRKLKWSIAGIALQLFCKSGGQPWRVKSQHENTLIIGISQVWSHGEEEVHKYFAYSIVTDSSGVFKDIQVLGDAKDKQTYLRDMKNNLKALLLGEGAKYETVVIHTTYKLRREQMECIEDCIEEVAQEVGGTKFAVVKVNSRHRFFGFSEAHSSMVPFESSFIRLAAGDFLIWFEGTQYHNPNITGMIAGPTHVQIVYRSPGLQRSDIEILGDLVNLSGANWRGFNAKSAPVSVFYCQLVGRFIAEFTERGLPTPEVKYFSPWFL